MSPRLAKVIPPALIALLALTLASSIAMTRVQLYGPSASRSDYVTHVEVVEALGHGRLLVPHPVFHFLAAAVSKLSTTGIGVIVVIALFQAWLALLVFQAFAKAASPAVAAVASLAIALSAPIDVFTFPNLFFGYFATTTYHNPTIITLKPLALLLFGMAFDHVLQGKGELSWGNRLRLMAVALVATLAKPSFSIVLLPAMLAFFLLQHRTVEKRRFVVGALCIGLPVAAVLCWQSFFLFGQPGDGIQWSPLLVARESEHDGARMVLKVVASLAFPLAVLAANRARAFEDRRLVFAWLCFLVASSYYFLLAEKGPRALHGNFGWGVLVSLFFVFLFSAVLVVGDGARPWRSPRRSLPLVLLGLHAGCGVLWFLASANALGARCNDGWGNWCW